MTNDKKIFCFWEPPDSMPAYLKLCMETWKRNLGGYEIVVVNYNNLDRYVSPGTYDLDALKKLRLGTLKDAILSAVLCEYGGVFMDVDTIAARDISPVLKKLEHAQMILFGIHLGFVAAQPRAKVLCRWMQSVQKRLVRLQEDPEFTADSSYISNAALAEVMEAMVGESAIGRMYEWIRHREDKWPRAAGAAWKRAVEPIWARRKGLFFHTVYRKYLTMLDRTKYGFMAELVDCGTENTRRIPWQTHMEKYRKFWFEEKLDVDRVFSPRQTVVGLHNSWTPDWYKALSEKEVLENDCLLSKTLRHVLGR